ncbi:MAG: DUF1003 domain-containing protein [Candidatus Magasanikbacteria bacterium]
MKNNNHSGEHPANELRIKDTLGQKASDHLTHFLGSWIFIISFGLFLLFWMSINFLAYELRWDPYPFIFLNLCLSCLAAIQAPIIMMSQNRQAERDRITAKYDYAVNRRAERGIEQIQKDLASVKRMLQKIK